MYSQYNDEKIICKFFDNKKNGYCVDIGAADGIINSNTRFLIEKNEWSGTLIEPHPVFFHNLNELYKTNLNIKTLNLAIFDKNSEMDFYTSGNGYEAQVSTLDIEFKEKIIKLYGYTYGICRVKTLTLQSLLDDIKEEIDFLSIDAEGVDLQILKSHDWIIKRPSLICVEHSIDISILNSFMESINYKKYDNNCGNTFYKNNLIK